MRTVLVSVTNKTGLDSFLRRLQEFDDLKLIATTSTAQFLQESGFKCTKVEELTGFPEILSGRVKTLHPRVFAGILSRPSNEDRTTLKEMDISEIDIVVVNLYAFEDKVKLNLSEPEMVEQIDVGGVALLRAAAKNFQRVAVISDPYQYDKVISALQNNNGEPDATLRKELAREAFERTSRYDRSIASYLAHSGVSTTSEDIPVCLQVNFNREEKLRYGENPQQAAGWYSVASALPLGMDEVLRNCDFPPFEQLQGKEMSANNITDAHALVSILRDISSPGACIIKHNNPCGVAVGKSIDQAFDKAYSTDPTSAFGGVYGFTEAVTAAMAAKITESFVELVVAPEFDPAALDFFKKKKNVRVLKLRQGGLNRSNRTWHFRDLQDFGFIVEQEVEPRVEQRDFKCVTKKKPEASQAPDIAFGWAVVRHLTSNAIFVAKDGQSLGFGIGQTSRIASVNHALAQAGAGAKNAILFSDGFFPATDNIESAAKAGISVIVQPGGSIKDEDVISACDKAGISMLLTGQRCFKH
jgi:phosphoribosylaminoimidazolecarboxamide formyltransferase / IMP cyclohydrolase